MPPRYAQSVEQWRPLAQKYFRPEDIDKALYVIQGESGGNPSIRNRQGSGATGLFQIMPFHGVNAEDPETSMQWAASRVYGGRGWKDWGEGATYEGKPFGVLGSAPYSGGRTMPQTGPTDGSVVDENALDPEGLLNLQMVLGVLQSLQKLSQGGEQAQSSSQTAVMPPLLDVLQEMRGRRTQQFNEAQADLPSSLDYYPGYEQGGAYDMLMGLIGASGQGGPGIGTMRLGPEQRRVQRRPLEGGTLGEDVASAMPIAMSILDGLRMIQTGSSGQGTPTNAPVQEAINSMIPGLLQRLMGGGAATPALAPGEYATQPQSRQQQQIVAEQAGLPLRSRPLSTLSPFSAPPETAGVAAAGLPSWLTEAIMQQIQGRRSVTPLGGR